LTSPAFLGSIASSPTPAAGTSGAAHPLVIVELVVAAAFVALGIRSLVRWLRSAYRPETGGERVLYALHVTARVGMWFAFAGFFGGYALVDEPQSFRGYVLVPLALAAIQLLTAVLLGLERKPNPPDPPPDD